ncbi:sensor histidine kinase [Halosimplex salinum]|uniref:sensor histidine kinase n=1 Tax=Halosimplex salinum TaxID=1710538 RepID=UPI000F49F7AE|nr:PAS domain-containing sensor histidine kinase [Halosimplex salinum]
MGDRVLVLSTDERAAPALASALSEGRDRTSVRSVSTLDDLFEELCYDEVHCLVIPADPGPATARRVELGVRSLYPDLPIVLLGDHDSTESDGDHDSTESDGDHDSAGSDGGPSHRVDATDPSDSRVVAAVRAALDGGSDSAASRPPSRMETLVMSTVGQFPMHIYAKDGAGRHVLATGATVDLADVIGQTDLTFSEGPPDHHRKSHRDDRRVIEEGEPILETEEYTASDDDEYAITSKVPWYDADGAVIGLAGITRDISTRKQRERELRRQNERLARVALVAAHRLRNELQVANGRLEMLPEETPELDVVQASHGRLASIVDDIVDLASQERAGGEAEVVWLSTLAREVWGTYDAPDARLVVRDDCRIVADPESVRILFEILLSNAIDHGGADVTVSVAGTDDGFAVADDGPGIDMDPPNRVLDAGIAASEDSDGFGLYVAQRIATDHGWELRAENGADGGARFVVNGIERPEADDPVVDPERPDRSETDDPDGEPTQ